MAPKTNISGRPVFIIDGLRTPFLKLGDRPGAFRASDLAVHCGRALLVRQPFDGGDLDEVILGCAASGPEEANIARVAALRIGCGSEVPAWSVQRNCASGMQALDSAALSIASGRSDLILAGGTESMSHHPVIFNEAMVAWLGGWNHASGAMERLRQLSRLRPAFFRPVIALLKGLTDPIAGLSMGQTAEELASEFGISRGAMDAYACESHRRLAHARSRGWLAEIESIVAPDGRLYRYDDGLREDTSTEKLGRLKPVFDRGVGKVSAGNSAQISDGAALLVLASENAVRRYGLRARGRLLDTQWSALDPSRMGLGPVHAMAQLLRRHDLATADIDYWEINEAFAAQVLACLEAWKSPDYCRAHLDMPAFDPIPLDRLNPDGGGISLGHPVGASGSRIVLHLLSVLERTRTQTGVASLCVGGGQGGAMLIQRIAGTP